jgi:ribosomal protein S18 acetylase RimI-like enzyme
MGISAKDSIPHFINGEQAPKILQMSGLETTILTALHVCSVAVDPAYQGRGFARDLMEELEKLALLLRHHQVSLPMAWSMTEAIALYRGLGYKQEGYQPRHFYGEDFLIFGKVLG